MAQRNQRPMTLEPKDLNDLDGAILDLMGEANVTPTLAKRILECEQGHDPVSRQYINQRLQRLAEHGHAENLHDTGVYNLRGDPRDN